MDDGKAGSCFTGSFAKKNIPFLKRSFAKKNILFLKEVLQRKIFFPQLNLYQNLADTGDRKSVV